MRLDLNKLISNILLFTIIVILVYMIPILKDLSLNGRFQVSATADHTIFLDTRTGESYISLPAGLELSNSLKWQKIPHTKPVNVVK